MKQFFEKHWESIKNIWKILFPKAKKIWSGYGYYISLVCLLTIFGITAYMYRTRNESNNTVTDYKAPYTAAMARVAATAEPTPAPTPYSPAFIIPVSGEMVNEYSPEELVWNDTLGQWIVHNGIDFTANSGTAVSASEDGTVSAIYEDGLLGNVIEISHEDGWISRYCSLELLNLVETGQTVKKGDIISSVGCSAICESSMGPHLHFELLKNGMYIAPAFE